MFMLYAYGSETEIETRNGNQDGIRDKKSYIRHKDLQFPPSSSVRPSVKLRGPLPGFRNGVDWRALVED